MNFILDGRKCYLKGLTNTGVQVVSCQGMMKALSSANIAFLGQIRAVADSKSDMIIPLEFPPLKKEFQFLFGKVEGLPPSRDHDHGINLEEGTFPINIRPYRHSPIQNNVITKMVKELLDNGTIKHGSNPYSSHIGKEKG